MDIITELEREALYILREVAAQFSRPALLFSGGKDSTVLIHLALKAFYPHNVPFRVLHIDTGHNFPEALQFRDALAAKAGLELIVRKVEDTISARSLADPGGKFPSRNVLQSVTLIDAIGEFGFDVCIGGGRRDEEKARAKERIFSERGAGGAWQPYEQRPELWNMYNGRITQGQHIRAFPISNWSELDVWRYIEREHIAVPSIYFAHERECIRFKGRWVAVSPFIAIDESDIIVRKKIRYRTVGDMTCTAAIESEARNVAEVIEEISRSEISERGATRMDDDFSDAAMEDRKMQGYF